MQNYLIKNTDIMLNGQIIPEGSTINLDDKDAESLSSFLEPINSESSKSLELASPYGEPKLEHKKRSK